MKIVDDKWHFTLQELFYRDSDRYFKGNVNVAMNLNSKKQKEGKHTTLFIVGTNLLYFDLPTTYTFKPCYNNLQQLQ